MTSRVNLMDISSLDNNTAMENWDLTLSLYKGSLTQGVQEKHLVLIAALITLGAK